MRLGILLVLCAALVTSAAVRAAEPQGGFSKPLRIVHFNAQCLVPPGAKAKLERFRWNTAREAHFERVAELIQTLDPDILNLLEVTNAESVTHLVKRLHDKGLKDYAGYHVESGDTFTDFDVALITKLKPDEVDGTAIRSYYTRDDNSPYEEKYSFTDPNGNEVSRSTSITRQAVYFFTVGGRKLGFVGLHLKANPDNVYANAQRSAEARVAQRIVLREVVARGYTPIVLGDLNDYDPDVPDRDDTRSTATKVLAGLKDYDANTAGAELMNAAERIVRKEDRYTSHWDRNEDGADDPDDAKTMIDHILLHKSLAPAIRRVFISHLTDLKLSDHWPVVVDLDLSQVK
jgi:endonuclease/exonuclease/phosphatase family metal-dependent hydrolase